MGQRCVRLPKRIVILIYRMRIKLSLLQWRLLPAGCQKEKTTICNRNWIRLQRRRDGNLPF